MTNSVDKKFESLQNECAANLILIESLHHTNNITCLIRYYSCDHYYCFVLNMFGANESPMPLL